MIQKRNRHAMKEYSRNLQHVTGSTNMQPKILLADDHSMIRKGLNLYMQMNLGYSDITEVSSCNGLMKELVKQHYTHLVLDIILSDGSTLEVIPNIVKVYPNLRIMIFSMQPA